MRSKHPTLQTVYIKTGARLDYEYTTSKKKRKNHYFMRNRTGNRQERFMFFLFCFVLFLFFFAKCLLGVYTQKKRKNRKLERTNTFMLTC